MEMIALMLSGLALLAAGVCLCLLMQEKKRNQERNAAEKEVRGMIDWCIGAIGDETTHRVDACNKLVERVFNLEDSAIPDSEKAINERIFQLQNRLLQEIYSEDKKICARVENLEKGIIPDYEKATAAVNAVNDFNQGISNLLNYDPVPALAAQRERERQGE